MAENESARALPIIRTMYNFAWRLYKNLKQGLEFEQYNPQEFNLPEAIKQIFVSTVLEAGTLRITDDYKAFIKSPARIKRLTNYLKKFYYDYVRDNNEMIFTEWAAKCCAIAANVFEEGFVEAPDVVVCVIHSMCDKYKKYEELRSYGCDI